MIQKIVIKVQVASEKCRKEAMVIAAECKGACTIKFFFIENIYKFYYEKQFEGNYNYIFF